MNSLLGAVAACALSGTLSAQDSPRKVFVDVGAQALAEMAPADRDRARALSARRLADPRDVAVLRRQGYSWDDAVEAASLAGSWGLELSQVTGARAAGHSWEELGKGASLAASSGFSFGTVMAMRESGQSWELVASDVNVPGVDFRDAPRDPAPPAKKPAPRKKAKAAGKATGRGPSNP